MDVENGVGAELHLFGQSLSSSKIYTKCLGAYGEHEVLDL